MSAASRKLELTPTEIESWVEDGKGEMESALRARREDVRKQYERQLKDLQGVSTPRQRQYKRAVCTA